MCTGCQSSQIITTIFFLKYKMKNYTVSSWLLLPRSLQDGEDTFWKWIPPNSALLLVFTIKKLDHTDNSHSLHWTVLGCGMLFLSEAGLRHYSCFAAALNSHWPLNDATLKRCTGQCRVKFQKVKSTVHLYQGNPISFWMWHISKFLA